MMSNLTVSNEDTRIILNRGLTMGKDRIGGLEVRGKWDEALLEYTDNRQKVRTLFASK